MTDKPDGKAIINPIAISVILLFLSLLIIAWLIVGSFVTYTPSVSATTMQNIYIARILHYGLAIALLNALAIGSLAVGRRSV